MSKKTAKDLPEALRAAVKEELKTGDTRRVRKEFKKGKTFYFDDYERPFTLTEDITMDVTEEYDAWNTKWKLKSYYLETARPADAPEPEPEPEPEDVVPPTRWQRLKAWLTYPVRPTNLPLAKLVQK